MPATTIAAARARPEARAAFAWFRDASPQWRDNDVYGHVNNAVHYTWFDSTVNAWLIERGFLAVGASRVVGLVVASGCEYLAEVAFPDRVACGLRVAAVGRTSVRYALGLFRNDADTTFAIGHFTHVYVRWPERVPEPHPAAFRTALATLRVG